MNKNDCCNVEPNEKEVDREEVKGAVTAYMAVEGMGCMNCANRVQNGLLALDGVLLADVQLQQGMAVAAYDPKKITREELVKAVFNAGNDGHHMYLARVIKEAPAAETIRF